MDGSNSVRNVEVDMKFTVGKDIRQHTAPQPIVDSWKGNVARMINGFNELERSFLELFQVRFSVIIPRIGTGLELGLDDWIPQAYSSEESNG
jgi:hypothetical protein